MKEAAQDRKRFTCPCCQEKHPHNHSLCFPAPLWCAEPHHHPPRAQAEEGAGKGPPWWWQLWDEQMSSAVPQQLRSRLLRPCCRVPIFITWSAEYSSSGNHMSSQPAQTEFQVATWRLNETLLARVCFQIRF